MDAISLLDRPHDEARALLRSGAPVHLFVNPVEYHGPHLSLHNDRLIAEGLSRALHARLAVHPSARAFPFLVVPDLEVGVEPAFGAGSRHAPFEVARAVIREACRAIAELGAQRVILHTFHGSPLHNLAIEAGVELLQRAGVKVLAPFNAVLRELLDVDPNRFAAAFEHLTDAQERAEMMRAMHLDFHAGFFETSMALHLAPDSVSPRYVDLPPCPPIKPDGLAANASRLARFAGRDVLAKELAFAASGLGWLHLDPFPGYTGRPHRATAAAGAVFARFVIDGYAQLVDEVLFGDGRSPSPIMPWVAAATAGGRFLGPRA